LVSGIGFGVMGAILVVILSENVGEEFDQGQSLASSSKVAGVIGTIIGW